MRDVLFYIVLGMTIGWALVTLGIYLYEGICR